MLYPATLDVLAAQLRFTTCCCATATPVPLNVEVVGEFAASLVNEIFPDEEPALCGANVTVNVLLAPALTVTGKVMPLTE